MGIGILATLNVVIVSIVLAMSPYLESVLREGKWDAVLSRLVLTETRRILSTVIDVTTAVLTSSFSWLAEATTATANRFTARFHIFWDLFSITSPTIPVINQNTFLQYFQMAEIIRKRFSLPPSKLK